MITTYHREKIRKISVPVLTVCSSEIRFVRGHIGGIKMDIAVHNH